jgi:hypothetical protein
MWMPTGEATKQATRTAEEHRAETEGAWTMEDDFQGLKRNIIHTTEIKPVI